MTDKVTNPNSDRSLAVQQVLSYGQGIADLDGRLVAVVTDPPVWLMSLWAATAEGDGPGRV